MPSPVSCYLLLYKKNANTKDEQKAKCKKSASRLNNNLDRWIINLLYTDGFKEFELFVIFPIWYCLILRNMMNTLTYFCMLHNIIILIIKYPG